MTISELFDGIATVPPSLAGVEVSGVTSDSREVQQGFVFVCIKGGSFDGHSAAELLLQKGAAAAVTEHRLNLSREINVENSRRLYPELLSRFYGSPTGSLKLCAVTGTNGKTTVVNLCAGILRSFGEQVGVIGTLGTDTGRGLQYAHSGPPTTPEPRRLYSLFREMADIGTKYCFIEASSQALAQYRFAAESFAAAAFTNLTQDHLDYHGSMENYYLAKRSLFDMCGRAVLNIDDDYGIRTAEYCRENNIPYITVSVNGEADFYTEQVNLTPSGAEFWLTERSAKKTYPVRMVMTGLYNVSNAIEAAVMCSELGFPLWRCLQALSEIEGVGGRLETLYSGDFTVIRDYAHTPDGLEKLLSTLRPIAKGRLVVLFGAAGERDKTKRPMMGEICARYGDELVVTSDNPAHEDPWDIIYQVTEGIPEGFNYMTFADRDAAIRYALDGLREGDLLALCGKGHEDYQIIGSEYVPFDEKRITENYFKEKGLI